MSVGLLAVHGLVSAPLKAGLDIAFGAEPAQRLRKGGRDAAVSALAGAAVEVAARGVFDIFTTEVFKDLKAPTAV